MNILPLIIRQLIVSRVFYLRVVNGLNVQLKRVVHIDKWRKTIGRAIRHCKHEHVKFLKI
jgi:hypothetical protein